MTDRETPLPEANVLKDLDKYAVVQLKKFLKERGVRSSGKKSELLDLARLYYNSTVLHVGSFKALPDRDGVIFSDPTLKWQDVRNPSDVHLPKVRDLQVQYYSFLTCRKCECDCPISRTI
jgi:hypothetical protein